MTTLRGIGVLLLLFACVYALAAVTTAQGAVIAGAVGLGVLMLSVASRVDARR